MSGIVSGISKAFKAVGSAVARVGKAVSGVAAATFTAGAASGAGSIASGGLSKVASSFGSSTLGRVLTGAVSQAAIGAVIGGGISALTGGSFGKGALMGGAMGAVTGGLTGFAGGTGIASASDSGMALADTATGVAPTGITSSAPSTLRGGTMALPSDLHGDMTAALNKQSTGLLGGAAAAPAAAAADGGGLLSFLGTEKGGNLLAGLGEGAMSFFEMQQKEKMQEQQLAMQAEEYDKQRAFELDREMRLRDSYAVDPSVLHAPMPTDTTVRPTPAEKYGRSRYEYDPALGRVVSVPA